MSEAELLAKIESQQRMIAGLERILKLNEEELANAEEMIRVYETITEFARKEKQTLQDSLKAQELTSNLSAEELKQALERIRQLEEANRKLKEAKSAL